MANPTTNFGWQMPQNTDLVKDLPADFEVFGQAVDTSLMDLKGGTTGQVLSKASNTDMDFTWVAQDDSNAIQNALLTTTGDTIYASGASTPARLGIGTTGQVLTVSGGVPTWATPSSGAYTLLTTATPSAANTVDFTSISGSYKHLFLTWRNVFQSLANVRYELRINSDAGSNYRTTGLANGNGTLNLYNDTTAQNSIGPTLDLAPISNTGTSDVFLTNSYGWMFIPNYTTSIRKYIIYSSMSDSRYPFTVQAIWNSTSAITSLNFVRSSTQTITGTFYLYGVN